MRSFDERIAEINRRSEKLLDEREKRRNHLLIACIPLVVCITLSPAFFLRDANETGTVALSETQPAMNAPSESWDGSSPLSVLRVEVSGLDFSKTYTDAADLMQISDQLYSYCHSESEIIEESAESISDSNNKENADTDDHHSLIADTVTSGTLKEEVNGENYNSSSGDDKFYEVTSDPTSIGYTITLTTDAGNQIEYYLSDNILENRTTNQSRKLTHLEVYTLKELLDIPHR